MSLCLAQLKELFPVLLLGIVVPLLPFIIAERIWPVEKPPRWRDYLTNILIAISAAVLTLPFGIAAGMWSASLRPHLPWSPLSFTFSNLAAIPIVGHTLEIVAMVVASLVMRDLWFHWAHRLEHRVPLLWAFHRIHHSDEHLNASSWARDNFVQNGWRAFFSVFTLGLIVDIKLTEAGSAAVFSGLFLSLLSMFYHSAIRVQLPWLDRIVVTPQVHRIHHSIDPQHYNTNFVDALPVFDIIFGTYSPPRRGEFPRTGLADCPPRRSIWAAQFGPFAAIWRSRRRHPRM